MPGSTINLPSMPENLTHPIPSLASLEDTFPSVTKFEAMDFVLQLVPFAIVEQASWKIVLANRPCEELFGYNLGELVGKTVHDLVPSPLKEKHKSHTEEFANEPMKTARPMGQGLVVQGQNRAGLVFPVNVSLYRFFYRMKEFVLAMIVDMRIGNSGHLISDQSPHAKLPGQAVEFTKEKNPKRRSDDQTAPPDSPDSPKTGGK